MEDQGLGSRAWGLGFRVWGLRLRVWTFWFLMWMLQFRSLAVDQLSLVHIRDAV